MPTALAVSPHLDDALFSCGGTLAVLAGRGWHVVVASLFTRSVPDPQGFALACQLDKGLGPDVDYMALRRAEDADACAAIEAEPAWLDFAEAPHRGYGSAGALFGPLHDDDEMEVALAAALRRLLVERTPALLLAPQAIGGHVDHVLTVRALAALDPLPPALWWTDFPYATREAPQAPFEAMMQPMSEIDVDIVPERKLSACACYRSQLGFQFGGRLGLERAILGAGATERFRGRRAPDLLGAASLETLRTA